MTDFARNDRGSPLFPTEIADCIVKQRLLKAVIRNILEQILLIPLGSDRYGLLSPRWRSMNR